MFCAALLLAAPAGAEPLRAVVLVTQAAGAGDLPDRLGDLAAEIASLGSLEVLHPDEARSQLLKKGLDPRTCGTDAGCLTEAGKRLGAGWVIAVGVGRFGELWGLDVRALEPGKGPPHVSSATWADPGPDWTSAMREALERVLPASVLAPAGRLSVRSGDAVARVSVDGTEVGTTPLLNLPVAPGNHRVELRKEGSAGAVREVSVGAGERANVEMPLLPLGSGGRGPLPVVSGGLGVAALAAAVILQATALSLHDRAAGESFPARGADQDAYLGRQTAAAVLAIAGAAGVTGFFLLR